MLNGFGEFGGRLARQAELKKKTLLTMEAVSWPARKILSLKSVRRGLSGRVRSFEVPFHNRNTSAIKPKYSRKYRRAADATNDALAYYPGK